jgi:hypothetical protein
MATDELLDLHRTLAQQQLWLEERWRETGGDAQIVVHTLRLWGEGAAVARELQQRISGPLT